MKKDYLSKLDSFAAMKKRFSISDTYKLYKQRFPYVVEDYLGINMNYYTSIFTPNNLIVIVSLSKCIIDSATKTNDKERRDRGN